MSRIGNKPITVPEGVEVKIDGKHIHDGTFSFFTEKILEF